MAMLTTGRPPGTVMSTSRPRSSARTMNGSKATPIGHDPQMVDDQEGGRTPHAGAHAGDKVSVQVRKGPSDQQHSEPDAAQVERKPLPGVAVVGGVHHVTGVQAGIQVAGGAGQRS